MQKVVAAWSYRDDPAEASRQIFLSRAPLKLPSGVSNEFKNVVDSELKLPLGVDTWTSANRLPARTKRMFDNTENRLNRCGTQPPQSETHWRFESCTNALNGLLKRSHRDRAMTVLGLCGKHDDTWEHPLQLTER